MAARINHVPHVTCPACGGRAFARSPGKTSPLIREVYYSCRNPDACGHRFVVEMVAVRTVVPSRFPKPLHTLPLTQWRAKPANDDSANDNPPLEAEASAVPT